MFVNLTHGIRLNYRITFFGNQISTVDSSRNHYQRIRHSVTPGDTGSVPVHTGTGTLVARDEDRIKGTIPMPTFARRPSTISSLFSVDISADFCGWTAKTADIGTATRQTPYTVYIFMLEDRIQKPSDYLF